MNEEDEKKDSEEELKEEVERYERQNQEAYDEEVYHNEELRRKQEQKSKQDIIEEAMGPDEDDDKGISQYALNRLNLHRIRERNQDPNAFQKQMDTVKRFINPQDPAFISELLLDLKTGYSAAKSAPGGLIIKGGAAAGAISLRRLGGQYIDNMLDEIFNTSIFKPVTPEGLEMPMMMSENLGGFGKKANKKIFDIQQSLRPKTNQMDLFDNPSDYEILELYKSQNKVVGQKPLPKRAQAGRALRPTDFDDVVKEFPDITPDQIFGYIEQVKAGKLGSPKYNPTIKRFVRNQKGLEGTLRFLNQKAAYSPNFDLSEIAAELTAEFGLKGSKVITPKTLENILIDKGGISFKTRGMKKAVQINSIEDLRKVYTDRLTRYKAIPAFERGHVFAADNIIKDNKVANLTDFKNNLEAEIGRSIYRQLDDEAIERLIKENVDRNFDSIEDTYQSVLEGNRKRKNLDDPDKVIADLYGTQYGLRESFLSYVYPDRSLGRLIPADLKATFTDLYKKELKMALLDFEGASVGPYALDKIKNKVAVDVLKSFPDVDTRGILEQLTLMSDKAYGKDMVDYLTGEAF